jgi:hypothetical protein
LNETAGKAAAAAAAAAASSAAGTHCIAAAAHRQQQQVACMEDALSEAQDRSAVLCCNTSGGAAAAASNAGGVHCMRDCIAAAAQQLFKTNARALLLHLPPFKDCTVLYYLGDQWVISADGVVHEPAASLNADCFACVWLCCPCFPAASRFAQFFISPLISADGVEREVQAVDSEHGKNLAVDAWRLHQLAKATANPQHPWARFFTGRFMTLYFFVVGAIAALLRDV